MLPVPLNFLLLKVGMESCVGVLGFARNYFDCNFYLGHGVYFDSFYVVVLFELVRLAYLSGRFEKMRKEIIVMEVTPLHTASLW
mmetsp:Transcript_23650/g.40310  ORF Transcript_23650/g.40310 Transcript_23650/m.40310 type:complete len:84 (-) Transcript_23650:149-400(-)